VGLLTTGLEIAGAETAAAQTTVEPSRHLHETLHYHIFEECNLTFVKKLNCVIMSFKNKKSTIRLLKNEQQLLLRFLHPLTAHPLFSKKLTPTGVTTHAKNNATIYSAD
jgi:hypothetical protein